MSSCHALVLTIGLGAVLLGAAPASAMPMNGLGSTVATQSDIAGSVENVRWICGPYGGCRWVPGYGYYRPWRPYWGYGYRPWRPYGWGYARPWHGTYGWGPYGGHRYW